jgi:hypothetical protein
VVLVRVPSEKTATTVPSGWVTVVVVPTPSSQLVLTVVPFFLQSVRYHGQKEPYYK